MLQKKRVFMLSVLCFLSIFIAATAGVAYGDSKVTVPVKVNLIGSCVIQNSPEIDFGDIDPLATPEDHVKTSSLNYTCTSGTSYKVEFNNGKYYESGNMRMKHESKENYIVYSLSNNCTNVLGTGSPVTCDMTGTISKSISLKDNPVGKYNDNVTVTLSIQ